jgi:hypothetical protein
MTLRNPQPETLDPGVEIPKGAPLAMGHDEDAAADHRAASQDHRAAVDAEGEDVGPREPGDHAEKGKKKP